MSDVFTQPTENGDPGEFDIDAWLTGATLPERTVTVYGDGKGYADLQQLITDFDAAREDDDEEEASLSDRGRVVRLAEDIERQRDALTGSKLTLRFRAILREDSEKIAEQHKGDKVAITYATLAHQCVQVTDHAGATRGNLTAAQVKALRSRIGEGQFNSVLEAAAEASYGRKVEIPFSLAASALLATPESSSN